MANVFIEARPKVTLPLSYAVLLNVISQIGSASLAARNLDET
jgi:molybdenum-dependent DNA-binding transcriptional regulator ModE